MYIKTFIPDTETIDDTQTEIITIGTTVPVFIVILLLVVIILLIILKRWRNQVNSRYLYIISL